MPCQIPIENNVKKAADCKCYSAVMRTYKCMKSDEPETIALEAAIRVYRYHHPEDSKRDASLTVQSWVHANHHH